MSKITKFEVSVREAKECDGNYMPIWSTIANGYSEVRLISCNIYHTYVFITFKLHNDTRIILIIIFNH